MIITWKPIGSKKPAIEYKQPEPDVLSIDGSELSFRNDIDNYDFTADIPEDFRFAVMSAKRINGTLHLELLLRTSRPIKEPEPIDYKSEVNLTWQE